MTSITIASVVEGEGEVRALPVLLRRIAYDLGIWDAKFPTPYRLGRGKMMVPGALENLVQAQARRVIGAGGILVLLDADDACPARLGPEIRKRAQEARSDVRVAVVLPTREFEAWFLGGAASLAGRRGLPAPLAPHPDPESPRDAKGWLSQRILGHSYHPAVDQAAFAQEFDMTATRKSCPSFDKLWRDVEWLLGGKRADGI